MLQEAYNLELVCLPSPTPNNPLGDHAKQCSYHQNQEHSTEWCFKVKDFLKELVRLGALSHIIYQIKINQDRGSSRARGKRQSGRGRGGGAIMLSCHPIEKQGKNHPAWHGRIPTRTVRDLGLALVAGLSVVVPLTRQGRGTSEVSMSLASCHHRICPKFSLQMRIIHHGTLSKMIWW